MDVQQAVIQKIEQLESSEGKKAAREYFGVSGQMLNAWKKNPAKVPFEAVKRLMADFNVEPDNEPDPYGPPVVGSVEEAGVITPVFPETIEEPEAAPPASGQAPPPNIIPHMTVPGTRPSGAPQVVTPMQGLTRMPGVAGGVGTPQATPAQPSANVPALVASITAALVAQGITDQAIIGAAVAGAIGANGTPESREITLPGGNVMKKLGVHPVAGNKTWNLSHDTVRKLREGSLKLVEVPTKDRRGKIVKVTQAK